MTNQELPPDLKTYINVPDSEFKHSQFIPYYRELITSAQLFLGLTWLDNLLIHPEYDLIFEKRHIGAIIKWENDEHGQRALGIYNDNLREILGENLNFRTPLILVHIISILEIFLKKGLGLRSPKGAKIEESPHNIAHNRPINFIDHAYFAINENRHLINKDFIEIIDRNMLQIGNTVYKRNLFVHERFQHHFEIDLNDLLRTWISGCELIIVLDKCIA